MSGPPKTPTHLRLVRGNRDSVCRRERRQRRAAALGCAVSGAQLHAAWPACGADFLVPRTAGGPYREPVSLDWLGAGHGERQRGGLPG